MEDIYGNLDNYNDVNALEELRSENTELKIKLEEYATAMEKLQKEFDTVSSEYKKLEHNYSSLLKTAKAEIERKTQIITNMNIEKDMLVLSALQNGNRNVLKPRQFIPNNICNSKNKKIGNSQRKNVKNTKEIKVNQSKKNATGQERLQEHQIPLENTEKNESKENTLTKIPKTDLKPDVCDDISIRNDYIAKCSQPTAMNIRHRLKSNPHTDGAFDKLSSDEHSECLTGPKQDLVARHKEERKSFSKNHDWYLNKGPETSTTEDKTCYLDSSCEPLKNSRSGKYYDGDRRRSREKNNISQRYKRHHNMERYNRKQRDYYDDHSQKYEYSRIRGRDSPANDHYHHHSYKDHRQYEKKLQYEQERGGPDRYVGKHKILQEYDEPSRKRQKIEPYGRLKEDGKWHDREIYKIQELTETFEQLEEQYTSCQSPDYISSDVAPEPIKVIKSTAEIQLEDPRLTTNKYILCNDKEGEYIHTVNSKHVNIIPVDKSKWGMKKVSMPEALVHLPSEDQLIKDLYTDIEIEQVNILPNSNEAGNSLQNEHLSNENNISEHIKKKNHSTKNVEEKLDKPTAGLSYKVKKGDNVKEKSLEKIEDFCINYDKDSNHKIIGNASKSPADKHNDFNKCDDISKIVNKSQTGCKSNINLEARERILSSREIIEGDLELSDETCDNTEIHKSSNLNTNEIDVNHYQKSQTFQSGIEDTSILSSVHDAKFKEVDQKPHSKSDLNLKNQELNDLEDNLILSEKTDEHIEINKKHKTKKKSHKHRESEHLEVCDRKIKAKKDKKEKPKTVKTKFNELFGDGSGSLITPDDLGIQTSNVSSSQLKINYMPIFEDALDATDLEQTTKKTFAVPQTKESDKVGTSEGKNGKIKSIESLSKLNEITKGSVNLESPNVKASNVPPLNEPATVVNTLPEIINFQNVNKENGIVATVIISTGVQPDEINSESRAESLVNAEDLLSDNIEQDQNFEINKHQDLLIKALATSTPHKQVVNQIALEIDSKVPEPSCDTSSRIVTVDNNSNTNNATQPPNEDLPDVRIFVKRRRRIVKPAK